MNTLTNLEAYTQYLIAQAVMSHDDSLDYVEAWDIASTLLHDFLESEEFWYREPQSNPHNLAYRLVEDWVNNIPTEQLK
tara:strand:- start:434 stop:670 length:237 start_codon:yes stop_codon:yes gene_type:complete